jgi:nitrous oxidase accessory protein NosD
LRGERALLTAWVLISLMSLPALSMQAPLPLLTVLHDDTLVDHSCRLVVPPGSVLVDEHGDGIVIVVADGVRIEMDPDSVLRGASPETPRDNLTGLGIVVDGQRDVTLAGLSVSGFRCGILARNADGLLIEDCDLSDNFGQRLRSTPAAADDGSDWLSPHHNDQQEWRRRYGAGLAIEQSRDVTLRRCRARRVQNGAILDRVTDSKVYDNDFSFLSGWGLALWRSSGNTICRNALDFCVRGYSHGVYNRGQDSAGLLLFEQCSDNVIAENSITHGGDGVFAFAGREALGEAQPPAPGFDHTRKGNNDNLFVGNDLSFAAAHGLELTFSFGNVIAENRLKGNAICGIWGGYSQDTTIVHNRFEANGEQGYGLERGGVNIEHGSGNRVIGNTFVANRCGVHLWWDEDEGLAQLPWTAANGGRCADNVVARNRFQNDTLALQLRTCQPTLVTQNVLLGVERSFEIERSAMHEDGELSDDERLPEPELYGDRRPVGGRPMLAGREHIVMTEWGPWDHVAPLIIRMLEQPALHVLKCFGHPSGAAVTTRGEGLVFHVDGDRIEIVPATGQQGVLPYTVTVEGLGAASGRLMATRWSVSVFPTIVDPRDDDAAFAAAAEGPEAVHFETGQLSLAFGNGGLGGLGLKGLPAGLSLPADHFGTRASTDLYLPAGNWRFTTLSDDGLRLRVDDRLLIDNWTWHGPTRDTGEFVQEAGGSVHVVLEHFELDGWAVIELDIETADS